MKKLLLGVIFTISVLPFFGKNESKVRIAQFEYFKYEGSDAWFDKKIDPKSQEMHSVYNRHHQFFMPPQFSWFSQFA